MICFSQLISFDFFITRLRKFKYSIHVLILDLNDDFKTPRPVHIWTRYIFGLVRHVHIWTRYTEYIWFGWLTIWKRKGKSLNIISNQTTTCFLKLNSDVSVPFYSDSVLLTRWISITINEWPPVTPDSISTMKLPVTFMNMLIIKSLFVLAYASPGVGIKITRCRIRVTIGPLCTQK